MTAGQVARRAGGLAVLLGLALAPVAGATDDGGEVRVLSGPAASSTVTVRARPDVAIDDRTPGAKPAQAGQGPASTGETFTGELTLFLHAAIVSRPAAIDVGDPVVSAVRLFPEHDGTTVTVFVRQPVTYTVSRPSAIGEVRIELKSRTRPLTVTGVSTRGQPRMTRPPPTGEGEVAVDAEALNFDQQTNTLTARGGVTLTRGDTTLTADEVVYDKTNAVAEARGHVVVTDPQGTMQGESMHLNLEDESGWIDGGDGKLLPTEFSLKGSHIEKKGGPQYSVANGVFTTCECGGLEKPSWSIFGRQTDVKLQGTGVVHGMTLRVKDVPVLYLPYFVFPASTERQSGFLIPRVGYSNRRGFQYEQPFYWAINKSTDATVAVDVETAARVGILGEYRYALSRDTHGQFLAGYWNEQIRGRTQGTKQDVGVTADIPQDRFVFAGRHVMPFYDHSKFYLDLMAVSDDQFLREINSLAFAARHDISIRTTRYTTSDVGVIKTWPTGLAWLENVYHQDLQDPQELALQRLPRVEGLQALRLFDDRAVVRLAGEAVDYQRPDGYDGVRADLAPELLLPFRLGRALGGSLSTRLRETAYHLTNQDQVAFVVQNDGTRAFRTAADIRHDSGYRLPELDANRSRELAEVNARLGTEFDRVFTFRHLGLEKLKHTIEPEIQYLYVPQSDRQIFDVPSCQGLANPRPGVNCNPGAALFSEGYLFDERDAINRRNFVSYGITTRLLGRPPTAAEAAGRDLPPRETGAQIDLDTLAQGVSADAVPDLVGPSAPSAAAGAPTGPPRELLRASILHGYDVSRTLVGNSHLSDVDVGLRLTPLDYLGLSYNTSVNLEHPAIRGLSVGAVAREPWWTPKNPARAYQSPSTIGISYRFIDKSVNQATQARDVESLLFSSGGVNELDGSVYLRLGEYLGFTFLSRYDLNTTTVVDNGKPATLGPHFLERDYFLRLISRCNCWVIEAGVADKTNPDERLYRVQLTLIGLGSFGRSPAAGRNFVGFAPLSQLGLRRPSALGGGAN